MTRALLAGTATLALSAAAAFAGGLAPPIQAIQVAPAPSFTDSCSVVQPVVQSL